MPSHDEARRAFLIGAVAGAGAAAGLASEATAQEKIPDKNPAAGAVPIHATSVGDTRGAFFNPDDAKTVAAFAERLMPGAPDKPGATDAGVLNYIDLALAGVYSGQQDFYRRGLAALEAYCKATHNAAFAKLDAASQDTVIKALDDNKATGFTWPSAAAFFNTLRTHTMEGMFADPVYGGNKDFAGWRLVGFPGAQVLFTEAEMHSREAFTRGPVLGLQSQLATRKG
jgi:gluconate 2-dehydrogenase gamma chain